MKNKLLVFLPHALILLLGELLFLPNMIEMLYFFVWWICFLIMGILFLPVTGLVFGRFKNGGYMFSKTLCLAVAGYLQWLLSSLRILPFRVWSCFLIMLLLLTVNYFVNKKNDAWRKCLQFSSEDGSGFKSIANQEALFMALLLFWSYLRALRPEIEDLEKYMDFGFVNAILRSDWFPAQDMWFSGAGINYYYLGHYFTAFLTKMTFIDPAVTYNLMMAALFALSFMLAFSVGEFLINVYQKNAHERALRPKRVSAGVKAGIVAGLAVCFAGNLHSLIFAVLFPQWNNGSSYWFPDATRYIGYNPDVINDKTIHEFPQYSFVVSDLHAHVINIIFVLTVVGLALSLTVELLKGIKGKRLLLPFILVIFLIGLFPAMNFWDYPIYVVFVGALLLYSNLKTYKFSKKSLLITIGQIATIALAAYIVTLPFQLSFESMGTQIRLVEHRSMLYQLGVLWGFQLFFAVALTYVMIRQYKSQNGLAAQAEQAGASPKSVGKVLGNDNVAGIVDGGGDECKEASNQLSNDLRIPSANDPPSAPLLRFIEKANPADAFVFIIFICAVGLVIIPELIYVVDIYPSHPRANTMFKLGYQAFILFGLGVGYTFMRLRLLPKKLFKFKGLLTALGTFLLASALLYPFYSINQWYFKHAAGTFSGLDGMTYLLKNEMPYTTAEGETYYLRLQDDYSLIKYINENIKGSPVIAESYGDSYTLNGRISTNTGLPNILNWYYHQILWRNSNYDLINERFTDINAIYWSSDPEQVRGILTKYGVEYIVVGQIERLNYPSINEAMLQTMGDVVFRSNDLYLIHVFENVENLH
ncbi:MAG: DUF2298 domain-containing protein [Oscillospiraceae bacterium]|nr:DUF2298 domain-containing protein [Oscillospiraceae bacterium]